MMRRFEHVNPQNPCGAMLSGGQLLKQLNLSTTLVVSDRVICHPTFMPSRKKNAFTLAETLIVLAILGVVAAITVPTLVKKQSEAANRTKIKKAMRTYDAAIQQMVRVNDISQYNPSDALNLHLSFPRKDTVLK